MMTRLRAAVGEPPVARLARVQSALVSRNRTPNGTCPASGGMVPARSSRPINGSFKRTVSNFQRHQSSRLGWGLAACEQDRRVRYVTCAQLVNELVEAADEHILSRVVARYGRLDLLLLDGWVTCI